RRQSIRRSLFTPTAKIPTSSHLPNDMNPQTPLPPFPTFSVIIGDTTFFETQAQSQNSIPHSWLEMSMQGFHFTTTQLGYSTLQSFDSGTKLGPICFLTLLFSRGGSRISNEYIVHFDPNLGDNTSGLHGGSHQHGRESKPGHPNNIALSSQDDTQLELDDIAANNQEIHVMVK
ncbi:hypothetical protein HAX54_001829, partial [Datura stramonium]|nr:hypothetical protein [Datura stramonium]